MSCYQSLQLGKPPLRVGLLLDSTSLPSYLAEVLDQILKSDFVTIELLVFNGSAQKNANEPRPLRGLPRAVIDTLSDGALLRNVLYSLYQHWDARKIDPTTDPLAMVACSAGLGQVQSMHVNPVADGSVHRFSDDDVKRIREQRLDVLIRFGFNILRGEVLTASKHGVWSFHHGDDDAYRGGSAQFWEIVEGAPISVVTLQVLAEDLSRGKVLCKGQFATADGFSQVRNRLQPCWGASAFMIQKLRELYLYGWDHVERNCVNPGPYWGKKKIYSKPTNAEMLRWLVSLLIGKILRRLDWRAMIRHWRIAIRVGSSQGADMTSAPGLTGFHWIDSPKGRFYADPFVVEEKGKHWIFFEDYNYATKLGKISCAEVCNGGLTAPLTALERPYHLSYPCVFRDHGTWYMIPESVAAGRVELYRCSSFPAVWKFERELLRGFAVDTTIWIEGGVYWFFVTFQEQRGYALQLWIYSAASLHGAWTAHPASPVSTDVRNARGAGAIFRHRGKLFRPSQDCSEEYGRSMTLNEIMVMDHQQYREEPRVTLDPAQVKGLIGTHTYGRAGPIEVIDGKTLIFASRVR